MNATHRKHHWYFYPLAVLLALAALFAAFLLFLTATEFRPDDVQPAITGEPKELPVLDRDHARILSFNIGFGTWDKDADFLMDGGTGTGKQDKSIVERNMAGLGDILTRSDADLYMLQEIDRKSSRTHKMNQIEMVSDLLPEDQWYYAQNYVCNFVPYPVQSPLGSIDSGVVTYSRYQVEDARRVSLPVPFTWPVRTANLKRCLLVSRIPLNGSDHELVLINLHLEAYDNGEGKLAQTRQLVELMQEEYRKGNYVIAGGDFNQTFPGVDIPMKPTTNWAPMVMDPLPDGWNYVYDTSVPSCRLLNQPYDPDGDMTQHYILDGFMVSPNVEVQKVQTLDEGFRFSDHNPVLLDVKFR